MTGHATPIRPARGPRPGNKAAKAATIRGLQKPREAKGSGVKATFFALLTVIVLVAGGMWVSNAEPEPDAHYLEAKRLVDDYEIYTPESLQTPHAASYDDALTELGLVDPESISAQPAADLTTRILDRRKAHSQRMAAKLESKSRGRSARAARARELSRGQNNSTGLDPWAANRVTTTGASPLCDHDGELVDHSDHDH